MDPPHCQGSILNPSPLSQIHPESIRDPPCPLSTPPQALGLPLEPPQPWGKCQPPLSSCPLPQDPKKGFQVSCPHGTQVSCPHGPQVSCPHGPQVSCPLPTCPTHTLTHPQACSHPCCPCRVTRVPVPSPRPSPSPNPSLCLPSFAIPCFSGTGSSCSGITRPLGRCFPIPAAVPTSQKSQ